MTTARKRRMDAGGYVGGRYFGHVPGTAIYEVEGRIRWFSAVRATSRKAAMDAVARLERNGTRAEGTPIEPCPACGSAWCVDPSCAASKGL